MWPDKGNWVEAEHAQATGWLTVAKRNHSLCYARSFPSHYYKLWPVVIATSSEKSSWNPAFPEHVSSELLLPVPSPSLLSTQKCMEILRILQPPLPPPVETRKNFSNWPLLWNEEIEHFPKSSLAWWFGVTFQAFSSSPLLISKHSLPAKVTVRAPQTQGHLPAVRLCSCSSLCPEHLLSCSPPHAARTLKPFSTPSPLGSTVFCPCLALV